MRRRSDAWNMADPDPALVRDILLYCAERTRSGRLQPSTSRRVRYDLLRFARFCGQPTKRVYPRHIERYLDTKRAHGAKRTSLSDIRGFFRWAVTKERARSDPTAMIDLGRPPTSAPRALTLNDAEAVVSAAGNSRDQLIVLLMLHLGLRAMEVARLELGDIDLRSSWLNVKGKGGQGGVSGTVPIPEEALAAINTYLKEYPATAGPLIRSFVRPGDPIQPRTVTILVSKIFQAAGVKVSPLDGRSGHALRHTCATDLADRGAPPLVIQEIMRHADLKTTQRYINGHNPEVRQWLTGRTYLG